ncbi:MULTISPECIES: DUF4133 domain-containing protein [Larkinella]|jgi:hypothetical protein|uniref:DUF4133 domain-containing protein n=1 Tax=Larkinella punicea TaxID=2315727 RepID=A0A368JK54_9BACT|nr:MULTISPECIES: DUF4133 domain-containing protein [Larkinella]RCR67064.1 DUF4133 domain-containing protein [Larkinella punicea]
MLEINKGIGKPVELKGLKGTYLYLAVGIVACSLFLALILYGLDVNTYLTTVIVLSLTLGGVWYCMRMSAKHGMWGLVKQEATRSQPKAIIINSAKPFAKLRETKRPNTRKGTSTTGR